jgi:hypothetical protein
VFTKPHAAAAALPPIAAVLAAAIAKQYPAKFPGNADSGAATLRASLTCKLQEHEYLAGIAVTTALASGPSSVSAGAATATLDENSAALAGAIGSVYGDAAGKAFLPLWQTHIGHFVDYALAGARKDRTAQAKARSDLDAYRSDFGAFLASANPNLTKDAVAAALAPHVETTFAALDAALAGTPQVFTKLRAAAGALPPIAAVLASAIAKQYPDRYPG